MKRLTPAGYQVLLNLAAGREASFGLYGKSAYGGLTQTLVALYRRGLITPRSYTLTDLGKAVVAELKSEEKT